MPALCHQQYETVAHAASVAAAWLFAHGYRAPQQLGQWAVSPLPLSRKPIKKIEILQKGYFSKHMHRSIQCALCGSYRKIDMVDWPEESKPSPISLFSLCSSRMKERLSWNPKINFPFLPQMLNSREILQIGYKEQLYYEIVWPYSLNPTIL